MKTQQKTNVSEQVILVDPTKVISSKWNTRQPDPTDPKVIELAASMKGGLQITPAIARPLKSKPGSFELAAGARRRCAAELNGENLELIVREISDKALRKMILIDNLQRVDPDPVAEARAMAELVAEGQTPEEIASSFGVPVLRIIRRLKLLNLTKQWEKQKDPPLWSVEMLEILATLSRQFQDDLLEDQWGMEGIRSVRSLQTYIAKELGECPADAPFLLEEHTAVKGCGTTGCAKQSEADLFSDATDLAPKGSLCMNCDCWHKRQALDFNHQVQQKVLAQGEGVPVLLIRTSHLQPEHPINQDKGKVTLVCDWEGSLKKSKRKKASKPGDRVAIDITDPEKIKTCILEPKPKGGASGRMQKTAAEKTDKEKRAEGIERLQAKRWQKVLLIIINRIEERKRPPLGFGVIKVQMLCSFGTKTNASGYFEDNKKTAKARWAGGRNTAPKPSNVLAGRGDKKAPQGGPDEHAWRVIKPVLLERLRADKASDWFSQHRSVMTDIENLAELLEIDLQTLKLEADFAIKAPKGWGPVDPHTLKPVKAAKKKTAKKPATKKPATKKTAAKTAAAKPGSKVIDQKAEGDI